MKLKILMVVLAWLIAPNPAHALSKQECIQQAGGKGALAVAIACIDGKDYEFTKNDSDVNGHEFHSKPINVVRTNGKIVITGQLSHMLSGRPDDQVFYKIIKNGNAIESISQDTTKGGHAIWIGPVATAVGAYFNTPIDPAKATEVMHKVGETVEGQGWVPAADAIITAVALRVQ